MRCLLLLSLKMVRLTKSACEQIEQQVFKVYEHFFVQESDKFQKLLAAHHDMVARRSRHPLDSDDEDDDRTALRLDQVSAREFEVLLDFFQDGFVLRSLLHTLRIEISPKDV
jgi:hypothetical protein